ncbi:hypothetical protein VTO42DRAFT_1294 [Malbranchea cinnamomea]
MGLPARVSELPLRLRNFFARYPPQYYSAAAIPKPSTPTQSAQATSTTSNSDSTSSDSTGSSLAPLPSPYTPSRNVRPSKPDPTAWSPSRALLRSLPGFPNPFLPYKNPETGRWRGAVISLRRQAELVKLAREYGVEELLPPGKKSTEYKETRLKEVGLRIKGTGIGQKVKGHKWERTLAQRLEERRKAMLAMPQMIRLWKQRGHGRGWKKYPRK